MDVILSAWEQRESKFDKRRRSERKARGRMIRELINQGMNNHQITLRLREAGFMVPEQCKNSMINYYRWKIEMGE